MELQATALPELNGMLEQKAEMAVHISLSDFTEEPQRAKTFLHMMRFVLKEQGYRLTELLLVLQGEGEVRFRNVILR
jgi:hypothetical protein